MDFVMETPKKSELHRKVAETNDPMEEDVA
jgi:hypothetical protein